MPTCPLAGDATAALTRELAELKAAVVPRKVTGTVLLPEKFPSLFVFLPFR